MNHENELKAANTDLQLRGHPADLGKSPQDVF
jgi:hypothetical protein